jgi:hypothetical protein
MLGGVEDRMQQTDVMILTADAATALAGVWNAAWLTHHAASTRARRLAAVSLAALNAGVVVQAMFSQALYSAHRAEIDVAPLLEPAPWLASRLLALAGVLLITMLIFRRTP